MPQISDGMTPCIVLGIETQIGLGIVRELGEAGVPVIGIANEPDAIGLASRFLKRGLVVSTPRSNELIQTIKSLGEEFGGACLMTVSETNLSWLSKNRERFGLVQPVVPTEQALAIVLDKKQTLNIAREVGIGVPETVEPNSMEEVEAIALRFQFPAVLKWKDPAVVVPLLEDHGLDFIKAEYVYSAQELRSVALRYEPLGLWPLVQQYCPGQGLGQFFFMHDGQAVRRFQHLRVAEWPPEGGFSSVCDAVPLSEHLALQEKSIALLQRIGWEGIAMVEYRLDSDTGEAMLMEINGRFWGSFPLAMYCGAKFALLAYLLQTRQALPLLPPPRENIRCRMVATEIKRLVRILFQSGKISDRSFNVRKPYELVRFMVDYFRPNVRYYVWSLSDPKPFWVDVKNLIGKIFLHA